MCTKRTHILVYLVAFLSLLPQLDGLLGAEGILPAADFLEITRGQMGSSATWKVPTFMWLAPSVGTAKAICLFGVVLAGCAIAGLAVRTSLVLLWAC
ncbi:hypothetical protein OAX78_04570, partial [Planctomycetota bacterium]|nr:hypothetical protein [Planctomycetota bacterium]